MDLKSFEYALQQPVNAHRNVPVLLAFLHQSVFIEALFRPIQ